MAAVLFTSVRRWRDLLSALAFGKRAYCVAAAKDASQTLLVIEYQHQYFEPGEDLIAQSQMLLSIDRSSISHDRLQKIKSLIISFRFSRQELPTLRTSPGGVPTEIGSSR
jgi:hypothetical protein